MASSAVTAPSKAGRPLQIAAAWRGVLERWLEAERHQLVLWLPVMLGAGVAAWFVLPDARQWKIALLLSAGVAGAALAGARGGRGAAVMAVAATTFATGLALVWWRAEAVRAPVLTRPAMVSVAGRVARVQSLPARDLTRLWIEVEEWDGVRRADVPRRVRVNVADDDTPAGVVAGSRVRVKARLMPPAPPSVPGAYDFARVAWFEQLGATGRAIGALTVIARSAQRGEGVRTRLTRHIEARLPGSVGGIAAALATGDVGAIEDEDAEAMRRAGLAHLLSVSGLHITAVVGLVMWLAMRMLAWSPRLALTGRVPLLAGAAAALAAIGYTWLTSVVRAIKHHQGYDMTVYAYARWSSLEQTNGSTLERQLANCHAYIDKAGWTLASDPIVDRGRSAFTGANITTGHLGKFAELIRNGTIQTPATLVVEELDRLSRQPADVMLSWLSPLVRSGLTIVVTQTGQVIDSRMLDHDMGTLMMVLITAFGSHKESKKKSERGASAWESKREKARAGEHVQRHHSHPLWLRVNDAGEFETIPHRVAIVRDIFRLRLESKGQIATAQWLNERRKNDPRYEVWSRGKVAPRFWTPVYVGRVIKNRAVLGEWQPSKQPRGGERVLIGEAIEGYYPAVIDPATFAQANDYRLTEQFARQGRGKNVSNLLGTRARCATCGGKMGVKGSIRKHRDGRTSRYYYLTCLTAKVAKACTNQETWAYDMVERAVLDTLLSRAMDDTYFRAPVDLTPFERAVHDAKAKVADIKTRMARLLDMMEAGDPMASDRYALRMTELASVQEALVDAEAELARLKGATSPEEHLRRVAEVRTLVDSEDDEERYQARQKVKAALHDIITDLQFDPETKVVNLGLVGGLGAMWIGKDGASQFVNMQKPGRRHDQGNYDSETKKAIRAMMRRTGEVQECSARPKTSRQQL